MLLRESPAISKLDIYVGNGHTKIDLMPTGILWGKNDLGKTKTPGMGDREALRGRGRIESDWPGRWHGKG